MTADRKPEFIFVGSLKKVHTPPQGDEILVRAETDNDPLIDAYGIDELDARHQMHQAATSFVDKCHTRNNR